MYIVHTCIRIVIFTLVTVFVFAFAASFHIFDRQFHFYIEATEIRDSRLEEDDAVHTIKIYLLSYTILYTHTLTYLSSYVHA